MPMTESEKVDVLRKSLMVLSTNSRFAAEFPAIHGAINVVLNETRGEGEPEIAPIQWTVPTSAPAPKSPSSFKENKIADLPTKIRPMHPSPPPFVPTPSTDPTPAPVKPRRPIGRPRLTIDQKLQRKRDRDFKKGNT